MSEERRKGCSLAAKKPMSSLWSALRTALLKLWVRVVRTKLPSCCISRRTDLLLLHCCTTPSARQARTWTQLPSMSGRFSAPARLLAPVTIKVPAAALLRSTCTPVLPYNSRRRALVCRAKYEDIINWEPAKNNPRSSNGRWHVGTYNAGVENGIQVRSVSENKGRLLEICKDLKISDNMTALMVASAMLETDHLDVGQHDSAKDNYTDGSANVSIFNLNADLVKNTGYNHGQPLNAWQIHHLNTVEGTSDAVKILKKVFDMYGIKGGLHYIRGGQTGYENPYGNPEQAAKIRDYDSGIKAILRQFDDDHSLLQIGDGRRVDVEVGYIATF